MDQLMTQASSTRILDGTNGADSKLEGVLTLLLSLKTECDARELEMHIQIQQEEIDRLHLQRLETQIEQQEEEIHRLNAHLLQGYDPSGVSDAVNESASSKLAKHSKMSRFFMEADADGDGTLDEAEKQRLSQRLGVSMDQLDINGDGKITKEDLKSWAKEKLLVLDENDKHASYEFTESMWDAMMFCGLSGVGLVANIMIMVFFALYSCAVSIFCGIGLSLFTEPDFSSDTEAEFAVWQRGYGSIAFGDLDPGWVIACSHSVALGHSTQQAHVIETLHRYLPQNTALKSWAFSGPLLSSVAILVWQLTLLVEVRAMLDKMSAIRSVPRRPHSEIVEVEGGDGIRLVSLSPIRMMFTRVVFLCRTGLVCILAYSGTLFLVYTSSMTDLLLNAAALEIILNIDELVFESLMPVRVKNLIDKLEPLTHNHLAGAFKGGDYRTMILNLLFTMAYFFSLYLWLVPYTKTLRGNYDALCPEQIV